MVISEAKISSKRQITLPIKIMKKLGLMPGDALAFDEQEGKLVIKPKADKLSALDIPNHFSHLPKKHATQADINRARERAYVDKF